MAKTSKLESIKDIFGPSFPELGKIAIDFYKKNNLSEPSIIPVENGMIILLENKEAALLSVKYKSDPNHAVFGGDSQVDIDKGIYTLEGRLKKEKIQLKAEACRETRYIKRETKSGGVIMSPGTGISTITSYAPQTPTLSISRIDNQPYWFVTDAKNK